MLINPVLRERIGDDLLRGRPQPSSDTSGLSLTIADPITMDRSGNLCSGTRQSSEGKLCVKVLNRRVRQNRQELVQSTANFAFGLVQHRQTAT